MTPWLRLVNLGFVWHRIVASDGTSYRAACRREFQHDRVRLRSSPKPGDHICPICLRRDG